MITCQICDEALVTAVFWVDMCGAGGMICRDSSPFWWLLEFWMEGFVVAGDKRILLTENYPEEGNR